MSILKKDNKPSRAKATNPAKATDATEVTDSDFTCEFWGNVLEPYRDHPGQAFIAAQTFSILQQAMKRGPKGSAAVSKSFDAAIHLLFPLTDFYPPCEELYRLAVDGKLRPQYEPGEIVAEAKAEQEREARAR
jgi:hypothetical protein